MTKIKKLKKITKKYKKLLKNNKNNIREQIIKYKVPKIYIYRLSNPNNKNLQIYEIGEVHKPYIFPVDYIFNWDDVSLRCCEGFWGDRYLVEKFVNSMNKTLIKERKKELKELNKNKT